MRRERRRRRRADPHPRHLWCLPQSPRGGHICTFQLGHDARRLAEPRGAATETSERRYVVQHVAIDATDGAIAAPPTPSAEFANGLAATFNEPAAGLRRLLRARVEGADRGGSQNVPSEPRS